MKFLDELPFKPVIIESIRNYNKDLFFKDLMSGIIVGIVALPLAIAFGIASGVTPEKGITTAIIAGFLASFLGGCKVQISGPTGAFIVIVYGIVEQFGVEGLAIATFMAGIILILMGVFKIGTIIRFIPYPIIVGFTSGIALTIFTTQIKDLFGLQIDKVPASFIEKWLVYGHYFSSMNLWTFGVGVFTIALIIFIPKISPKIPSSLIAIVVMTVVVLILKNNFGISAIETIGDRFQIRAQLPQAQQLGFTFDKISLLLSAAITIAILGSIESLLSATVADGVTGDKHDSNTELIGQGVANVVVPFFGGIPATGAIARTMTNINNGGKTPISGIIHAGVLLLILLFLGDLSKHIPMACLAGILIVVAYNMSEWRNFRALLKNQRADVAVLLTTFLLTVIFDLTIAIEIGLLLAVILFIRRIGETSGISVLSEIVDPMTEYDPTLDIKNIAIPEGAEVYEIDGPFFFGVANAFEEQMKIMGDKPKVRIIRMRKVPFIDSTGLHNLEAFIKNSQLEKIHIILSGVNNTVRNTLEKSNVDKLIGHENICPTIHIAIANANEYLEQLKLNKHS
ncbi:MAG: sulfate permease [Bacteroidales bacterium]|nr:sulfate permease [Bacteroidales bacterium]